LPRRSLATAPTSVSSVPSSARSTGIRQPTARDRSQPIGLGRPSGHAAGEPGIAGAPPSLALPGLRAGLASPPSDRRSGRQVPGAAARRRPSLLRTFPSRGAFGAGTPSDAEAGATGTESADWGGVLILIGTGRRLGSSHRAERACRPGRVSRNRVRGGPAHCRRRRTR
jgi:hypothetical protein